MFSCTSVCSAIECSAGQRYNALTCQCEGTLVFFIINIIYTATENDDNDTSSVTRYLLSKNTLTCQCGGTFMIFIINILLLEYYKNTLSRWKQCTSCRKRSLFDCGVWL